MSAALLLDTCVLLWLAADPDKLSARARDAIREHADSLFVSAITAFEIAIKARKGRLELALSPKAWYEKALRHHGLAEISLDGAIAARAVELPPLHNDPCDRFIIATALQHGMAVVTSDALIAQYKQIKVVW